MNAIIGATARLLRPVCLQNLPERLLLPATVRDGNPHRVPRRLDGTLELATDKT